MKFLGTMKMKIRAPWVNALIVKVFGKTMDFHILHAHILGLWKPIGRMDYLTLRNDFFLIRFHNGEDHARVLNDGPWFVGGHYLSIRGWEPNFKSSTPNMSSVAMWIWLPKLPIEYYEPSTLRIIGETIGPVLRIDTYIAAETRGRFTRLCVQVNLDEPILKLLRMEGVVQPVQYEGLSSLCFGCGCVGHRVEKCLYTVRMPEGKNDDGDGVGKSEEFQSQPGAKEGEAFVPWVLVSRRREPSLKPVKDKAQTSHLGATNLSPRDSLETNPFFSALGLTKVDNPSKEGK